MAATGSFSAAARELGCTQPAVSQQMRALEQAAGTALVARTGRAMRLTQAGEALVRHAAGILAGLAAAEEEMAAIAGLRAGRVRLVSFPSGTSALVPPALAAMRAEHPGVRISLVEAEPPRSVEMLRTGECEIALAFRYPGESASGRVGTADGVGPDATAPDGEWEGLVAHPLLRDRLVCLVPEDRELGTPDGRVAVGDLADESWIAGCPRCRGHLVEVCERAGFTPRIDFATDDHPAVIGLVAAGLGVAVLPELALEAMRPKGVRRLRIEPEVEREIVALTLPDYAGVPSVGAMVERLAKVARR